MRNAEKAYFNLFLDFLSETPQQSCKRRYRLVKGNTVYQTTKLQTGLNWKHLQTTNLNWLK